MNTITNYEKLVAEFEENLSRKLEAREMDFLSWLHSQHEFSQQKERLIKSV